MIFQRLHYGHCSRTQTRRRRQLPSLKRRPEDIFTPEDFSEEQQEIARTTAEFAEKSILPRVAEIEAKNFPVTRELLLEAGRLGLMSVDVPEEYGGSRWTKVTSALVSDRIAVSASFSVSFSAHTGIGTLPVIWYGTPAQKEKYCRSWQPGNGSRPTRFPNLHPALMP